MKKEPTGIFRAFLLHVTQLFISLATFSVYGTDDISGTLDNKVWIKPLCASFSWITHYVTALAVLVYKHKLLLKYFLQNQHLNITQSWWNTQRCLHFEILYCNKSIFDANYMTCLRINASISFLHFFPTFNFRFSLTFLSSDVEFSGHIFSDGSRKSKLALIP